MEKAFDTLIKLLELHEEKIPLSGKLVELEIDEQRQSWFFNIELEKPLDIEAFSRFISRLESLPSFLDTCSEVAYVIDYAMQDYDKLQDYYFFALKRLTAKRPRYNAMSAFEVEQDQNKLFIVCPKDGLYVEELLVEVERKLLAFGFDASLSVRYCEDAPTITEQIENAVDDEEEETHENEEKIRFERFYKRRIEKVTHKIEDIPIDEDGLLEYKSANHGSDFAVEGIVESFEKRDIKKETTLYTFVLSSVEDSIYVKKFVKEKDEAAYLDALKEGMRMRVSGTAKYDNFTDEVVLIAQTIERTNRPEPPQKRKDEAEKKRVELHVHSKMSTLDGIDSIEDYVRTAAAFEHPAIALTDHDNVQAFPEFHQAAKKHGIKPIFGAELSIIDEANTKIAVGKRDVPLREDTYTVFDIETTGLSVHEDKIIEISAVKIKDHQIVDSFDSFVNPEQSLSPFTTRLTGITNRDVKDAETIDKVLPKFKAFFEDTVLVAHNAVFDIAHIDKNLKDLGIFAGPYPHIDTLEIARQFYGDKLKRFNLKAVAKHFGVELTQHHRAEYDTRATANIFLHMLADLDKENIKTFDDLNRLDEKIKRANRYKNGMASHVSVLVRNQKGLKNLYKLISLANTRYFHKGPKLPKKVLQKHREGLLIGSGCMNGDFFETALNQSEEALREKAKFYDYLEIQPPEDYYHLGKDTENIEDRIEKTLMRIRDVAVSENIPLTAVSDAHHIEEESVRYRDIYIRTPIVGGGYHKLSRYEKIPSQYFRTTDEMLEAFPFFDAKTRSDIVVENPRLIAEKISTFEAFNDELYAPTDDFLSLRGVPSIETKMQDMVQKRAHELYGDTLPPLVKDRLEKEMESITKNKFSTVYYISYLLVKKSLDDGYLVGSRGSVGSSFVAMLMDITEVNPLPPHYACPKCHFTSFKMTPEEERLYGVGDDEKGVQSLLKDVDSGFDLKKMTCPKCQETMRRDGHDIPFETFLGFKGDKVPDIDLNFSGDYQGIVHEYIRELFGKDRAFRAGTISTVASKTAYGFVKGYAEKKDLKIRRAEIDRRAKKITGVKRSTGQHPGGIVVVPSYKEIFDVTPVQYPGDDTSKSWQTTHFDYHSFEDNLFKLDVLGHDDPTMIRYLMDFVKEDPISFPFSDARDIPVDDPKVYKLLSGTDVLHLKPSDIKSEVASYGVPEMGTSFVRGMLSASRPDSFADIVKISGLSHGTDVWLNNAEKLVTGKTKYGKISFKEVIGCRDDIMVYLIQSGLPSEKAFEISEFIRKGKASKQPKKWQEYKNFMREYEIPEWYIWSAGQIKYMFPKAHATAYVIMALRIAWFKLYRPIYFYSAYFSKRANYFDLVAMQGGEYPIEKRMKEIDDKGNAASEPEKRLYTVLEVALEMVKRGFYFAPLDIMQSAATEFTLTKDGHGLRLPFVALDGLGEKVAQSIVKAREEKTFTSVEDIKERTTLSTTLLNTLDALDAFGELPKTSQLNLFDL